MHNSALCYNPKISLYLIDLGYRVKKINTEMSVQSSKGGTGLDKNLKKKNKAIWISATNSCNSTDISKIELFYISATQYLASQYKL